MHGEGAVVAGDPAAAEEQVGGHVEEGVGGPFVGVDGFALRHVEAMHVRFGAASQLGGLCGGPFGSGALRSRVCGGVFGRGGHGVPFGLGRPVRSTLTLLILVPRFSPTPRPATRPITRAGCPRAPPLPLSRPIIPPPNPPEHAEGGRIRHGCSPLRGEFPLGARAAGDYGGPSPEGMLGVHPRSPAPRSPRW